MAVSPPPGCHEQERLECGSEHGAEHTYSREPVIEAEESEQRADQAADRKPHGRAGHLALSHPPR